MTDARRIIDYAYDDNGKEMRDALYSAIHDRVAAHFEAKKEEIARNLIRPEEPTEEAEESSAD